MRLSSLVVVALISWSVAASGGSQVHSQVVGPPKDGPEAAPRARPLMAQPPTVPIRERIAARMAVPIEDRPTAARSVPAERPATSVLPEPASHRVEVWGTVEFPQGTVVPEDFISSVSLRKEEVPQPRPKVVGTVCGWKEPLPSPGGSGEARLVAPSTFEWGPISVEPGDFVLRITDGYFQSVHERKVTIGNLGAVFALLLPGVAEVRLEIVDEVSGERPSLLLVQSTGTEGIHQPLAELSREVVEHKVLLGMDGTPFGRSNPTVLHAVAGDHVLEVVPAGPYAPIEHRFSVSAQGADLRIVAQRLPTARIWLQDALGRPSSIGRQQLDQLVIEPVEGRAHPEPGPASDAAPEAEEPVLVRVRGYDLSASSAPKVPQGAAWQEPLEYVPGKGMTARRWFRQRHQLRPWRPELTHMLELSFREPGRYLVAPPLEVEGSTFEPLIVDVGPEPTDWVTSTKAHSGAR